MGVFEDVDNFYHFMLTRLDSLFSMSWYGLIECHSPPDTAKVSNPEVKRCFTLYKAVQEGSQSSALSLAAFGGHCLPRPWLALIITAMQVENHPHNE